jgi:hypothetical protein
MSCRPPAMAAPALPPVAPLLPPVPAAIRRHRHPPPTHDPDWQSASARQRTGLSGSSHDGDVMRSSLDTRPTSSAPGPPASTPAPSSASPVAEVVRAEDARTRATRICLPRAVVMCARSTRSDSVVRSGVAMASSSSSRCGRSSWTATAERLPSSHDWTEIPGARHSLSEHRLLHQRLLRRRRAVGARRPGPTRSAAAGRCSARTPRST